MEFTQEEFSQSFNENEELRGQILETIASSEHGKSYLENHAKSYLDANSGAIRGELYGNIDNDLKDLGFEKPTGVKTYAFLKDTVQSLKEKAALGDPSAIEALKQENESLKSKIESGDGNTHYKDLYESGKSTWEKELAEKEAVINGFHEEKKTFNIKSDLNGALSQLSLNDEISQSIKDIVIKDAFNKLTQGAKIEGDGTVSYYGEDGQILMNKRTMAKKTAKEILQDALADIVVKKPTTQGGADDKTPMDDKKRNNLTLASAKTQMELNSIIEEHLSSNGELKGTKEFVQKADELFKEYNNNLPLR